MGIYHLRGMKSYYLQTQEYFPHFLHLGRVTVILSDLPLGMNPGGLYRNGLRNWGKECLSHLGRTHRTGNVWLVPVRSGVDSWTWAWSLVEVTVFCLLELSRVKLDTSSPHGMIWSRTHLSAIYTRRGRCEGVGLGATVMNVAEDRLSGWISGVGGGSVRGTEASLCMFSTSDYYNMRR